MQTSEIRQAPMLIREEEEIDLRMPETLIPK
jgi:hypothetical protein